MEFDPTTAKVRHLTDLGISTFTYAFKLTLGLDDNLYWFDQSNRLNAISVEDGSKSVALTINSTDYTNVLMQDTDGAFWFATFPQSGAEIERIDPKANSVTAYPIPPAPPSTSTLDVMLLKGPSGNLIGVETFRPTSSIVYGAEFFQVSGGLPPSTPRIFALRPTSGSPGSEITVYGNFLNKPISITINGQSAQGRATSSNSVVFKIPSGATSGPVQIATPGGTVTSSQILTVN